MDHRIVMVGAGYWAQFQLEGWRDAGAPLVALCNRSAAPAQALAQRYAVAQVYTDVTRMLDAERPTLVDVVLPPEAQEPVVRAALERGIPTICQKPFGIDLTQAEAMTALAKAQATPLVVHENFRFAPWFRECKRLIDSGHFGRVHGITFRLRPGDGQGPRAYLDRQPYFQTMPRFLVRETAVHFIDTFRYLMGEVVAVTARLRRLNPVIAGEDAGLLIFEFDDERSGLFDGNRLNDHVADNPRRTMGEMWLEGERGVLRLDGEARLWWKLYDESKWLQEQFAKAPPKGFRFLATWEAGFRSMTTKEALNSPDDAKGKKLRTFPNEMMRWTLEAMGFNIQIMPLPEVYLAIQQGAVRGQENPIDTIYSNKFYEVAPHVTLTNHVYSPIPLAVSEKTWAKFSPADQKAVTEAARVAAKFSRDFIAGNDANQLAEMTAKGAKINAKPNVAAFRAAVQPVYAKARDKYGADVDAFLKDAEAVRKAVK